MEVYVVICRTHVDYHGTYEEIIGIYSTREKAIKAVDELNDDNHKYEIDYDYNTYKVM